MSTPCPDWLSCSRDFDQKPTEISKKRDLKLIKKLATYGAIDDVTVSVNNSQISQTRRGKWESGGIMGKAVQTDVSKTFENLEKI